MVHTRPTMEGFKESKVALGRLSLNNPPPEGEGIQREKTCVETNAAEVTRFLAVSE